MSSVNIGKIFDIEINLHYSWFFILILLAWSLATDFFPSEYAGFSTTGYWILGVVAGVLLFACVLAHELSHSLTAKYHGLEVNNITLFFFGGIANAGEEGLDAGKEFQIAIAGPVLSVALSGIFFLLTLIALPEIVFPVVDYLFKINLILAAFNMVPGFPLDGGRVFRSIAWKFTGNLRKATRYASTGGKIFGGLMIVYGFYSIFAGTGGLWYILLGGFLYVLAKASYQQVVLKEDLSGVKVKDVMSEDFAELDADENLESFVDKFITEGYEKFVVTEDKKFYVLDFEEMKEIPRQNWPVKQVKDIMVEVEPARQSHNAYQSLQRMQEQGANLLPVAKKDEIIGVITTDALLRTSQVQGLNR